MKYDYLIVGAGLYGAVIAHEANLRNKRCLVIDKRHHIGGNIFTEDSHGIHVHKYGAHIFHTNNKKTWDYLNKFCSFNNFINTPIAKYKNKIFNLPFNMHTFYQMWGVTTPDEAKKKISEQIQQANIKSPRNLEEQAISLVGEDIYKTLIKGYTGDENAPNFQLQLLKDYPFASPTTIITLMTNTKESQLTGTHPLFRNYLKTLIYNSTQTSSNSEQS